MNSVISWKLLAATAVFGLIFTPAALAADRGPGTKVVTFCDGSAQGSVFTNTSDTSTSTSSTAFVPIANTTLPGGSSGSGDTDTYTVTFAGEASATGGGSWLAQAQFQIGAGAFTNMAPVGPNSFHRGNAARTQSMTWCNRINSGTSGTNFRIQWAKSGGTAGGLAIVDDYIIQVQRSE